MSVLASYASDYYAGQPAVTMRQKGQGRVVHFGSFFTPESVTALLDVLDIQDPLAAWAEIPAEVQTIVRSNDAEQFCFLLNFTSKPQAVTFKVPAFDLLEELKLKNHAESLGINRARSGCGTLLCKSFFSSFLESVLDRSAQNRTRRRSALTLPEATLRI